jgi:deoxyadenosine/deoxycytidine kinase|tara:strand:- start:2762 stop:3289 length:528 start_codon:yes stop_codon:yes gene_type:complete
MKCLAIGGVPATGKTTLMKMIINQIKPKQSFKFGLLRGYIKDNTAILGIYKKGEVFAGTDKLSMAVQKDFDIYVDRKAFNISFEGDRLFTGNNLKNLTTKYNTRIIILDADEETLKQRHINRGDNQSETFLRSRNTKIKNILEIKELEPCTEHYKLLTEKDSTKLANELSKWLVF